MKFRPLFLANVVLLSIAFSSYASAYESYPLEFQQALESAQNTLATHYILSGDTPQMANVKAKVVMNAKMIDMKNKSIQNYKKTISLKMGRILLLNTQMSPNNSLFKNLDIISNREMILKETKEIELSIEAAKLEIEERKANNIELRKEYALLSAEKKLKEKEASDAAAEAAKTAAAAQNAK